MSSIEIKALTQTAETHAMLVDMLIETVAAGGSV
ncbi:MAG: GNAT family N-acetyltransferase, partial [Mesorhizobium sp.]